MTTRLIIRGPARLSGTVKIQGAKNAAMKYVLLPLLTPGIFTLHNIPNITSIHKLLDLTRLFGGKVSWTGPNDLNITSSPVRQEKIIPTELFYFTSGAIFALPIVASLLGRCKLSTLLRPDTGGDQIGTRTLAAVERDLAACGFQTTRSSKLVSFHLRSTSPFVFTPPNRSFGASLLAVLAGLFKNGTSMIDTPSLAAEFLDILRFLQTCGAQIEQNGDQILVQGNRPLHGIEFTSMSDKNDLATWACAAIATHSDVICDNLAEIDKLGLEKLWELLKFWQVGVDISGEAVKIRASGSHLLPVNILAGNPPLFHTDWQPLVGPILTQIPGQSSITDAVFSDRLGHWTELGKLGAKFTLSDQKTVTVSGPSRLTGTTVSGNNIRAAAGLAIAALIAHGTTVLEAGPHLDRGYEGFPDRLRRLGVDVKAS